MLKDKFIHMWKKLNMKIHKTMFARSYFKVTPFRYPRKNIDKLAKSLIMKFDFLFIDQVLERALD